MPDSRHAGIFMQNFAQGFSFVDAIKRGQKADQRLETRLAEERQERSFQRRRQQRSDRRVDLLFGQQQEDRATRLEDEAKRKEGEALALDPAATDAQLREFAQFSPGAAAELEKRERLGAARTVAGISRAEQQSNVGLSAAVTQQPGAGPVVDPATAAAEAQGFESAFQPTRGPGSLKRVSEEDIKFFSPEHQRKGFVGRAVDDFVGTAQQATRAIGNVVAGVASARTPAGITGPQAAGAALSGDTFVPNDYISGEEFQEITDPQEREDARAHNAEIDERLAAIARNPNRNKLSRPFSFQGARQEGGEILRQQAQIQERVVVDNWNEFLEGEGGKLETAALAEPSVTAVAWFNDRATYKEAQGKAKTAAVDRRMVPVYEAYQVQVSDEITQASPGSAEHRQLSAKQRNIHSALNEIAADQPKVARQAGINSRGLKIGDTPRAQNMVEAIYDPERPAPNSVSSRQLNSAITVASRVSPNKRLNDNQLEAVATLADAGWLDKSTAMTLMMTGQWPPGTNPNAVKSISNGFAITEGGSIFRLPEAKKPKVEDVSREIGTDQLSWIAAGAKTMGVPDERLPQVHGLMSDHSGWLRKHYNVNSQESMIAAGRALGQSVFLSGQEHRRMANDGWYKFTNPKNAPTPEEIFLNPDMRNRLATEYNSKPIPMPAVGDRSNLDIEPFKQSLREGVHGPELKARVDSGEMSEDEVLWVWFVMNATPEEIAAANQQGE